MSEPHITDLTFPNLKYGKQETPWDLRLLLYKGGAAANLREVGNLIAKGALGNPVANRFPLVQKLHDVIAGRLAGGGSRNTARTSIEVLRRFYSWAEEDAARSLSMESIERLYVEWTDHLLHRQRIVGDIDALTVSREAADIARMLDEILDMRVGLLSKTRIRKPSNRRPVLGAQADKQNIEQTITFCHALLDITDALSVEAIQGSLPVPIHFRTGQIIEEWSGLKPLNKVKALTDEYAWPYAKKIVLEARAAWEADTSLRTRYVLANLRIQAEMLIFISQTGMNLAQAHCLKMGKFRYRSHLDGYQVQRVYKGRRRGEVEFEIFSEYKVLFERYLKWRDAIFPGDDDRLFPLVNKFGEPSEKAADVATKFQTLRERCKRLEIYFISPSILRKTRINWLLRLSRDPAMTAEMHAHTLETLIRNYEQPHLQVAMVEISRFHARSDPAIAPPGPGVCIKAVPKAILGTPPEAPVPDCASPAGCLFCEHQRDIDSEDHVWSLSSYRHFKSLELASYRLAAKGCAPISAVTTMDRVTAKLKFFKESSEVRTLWVCEALARIEEGDYHPRWDGFIQLMEVRTWQ